MIIADQVSEQVFCVNDTDDIVFGILIYGNP